MQLDAREKTHISADYFCPCRFTLLSFYIDCGKLFQVPLISLFGCYLKLRITLQTMNFKGNQGVFVVVYPSSSEEILGIDFKSNIASLLNAIADNLCLMLTGLDI